MDLLEHSHKNALSVIHSFHSFSEQEELVLVPDNYAEIIIPIFDGKIAIRIIGSTKYFDLEGGNAYFLTPRRRGMEVWFEENAQFVILKVNPVYSKLITGQLDEVSNGIFDCAIDTSDLQNLKLSLALEDVYEISSWISDHLLQGYEDYETNSTVEESIARIKDTGGAIKIKDLYTNLNISKSKLEKHFNSELRMTPKEFCKIEKINHFIKAYNEGYSQNLTELTYKCGYYDQSHLIKDFRYFLDISPKRFFANYTY